MFLEHDARAHTDAGTLVAIQGVGLEAVTRLPYSLIWHRLTSGCLQHSRNLSQEFMLHVMKKFKLLRENGFENSPKNSTPTGSKKLFQRWRRCIEREGQFVEECSIGAKVHILCYILSFVSFRYLAWM